MSFEKRVGSTGIVSYWFKWGRIGFCLYLSEGYLSIWKWRKDGEIYQRGFSFTRKLV